jgi:hypothetical protein
MIFIETYNKLYASDSGIFAVRAPTVGGDNNSMNKTHTAFSARRAPFRDSGAKKTPCLLGPADARKAQDRSDYSDSGESSGGILRQC